MKRLSTIFIEFPSSLLSLCLRSSGVIINPLVFCLSAISSWIFFTSSGERPGWDGSSVARKNLTATRSPSFQLKGYQGEKRVTRLLFLSETVQILPSQMRNIYRRLRKLLYSISFWGTSRPCFSFWGIPFFFFCPLGLKIKFSLTVETLFFRIGAASLSSVWTIISSSHLLFLRLLELLVSLVISCFSFAVVTYPFINGFSPLDQNSETLIFQFFARLLAVLDIFYCLVNLKLD